MNESVEPPWEVCPLRYLCRVEEEEEEEEERKAAVLFIYYYYIYKK